jgi:tetratricopeptide (TPR) repeat protein
VTRAFPNSGKQTPWFFQGLENFTKTFPRLGILAVLFFQGLESRAADTRTWLPNFEEASAKAKAANRDLFVFVGGSDWSVAARTYKANVILSPQLVPALGGEFLWLEIDHPEMPTEAQKEAAKPNRNFNVTIHNYPGVVLLDSEGRCYLKLEAPKGGVVELAAAVKVARALKARRDSELALADKAMGLERARHLGAALDLLGPNCLQNGKQSHRKLLDELKKLDPNDTLGTQRRLTFNPDQFAEKDLWPLTGKKKFADAHKLVDKELADLRNNLWLRQHLMALKFFVFQQEEKLDEAVKQLQQLIALDRTSDMARQAAAYIANITQPVTLASNVWKPEHLRFYFAEWRLDVTRQITGAGEYAIQFKHTDGDTITVRDVAVMNGSAQVAQADMPKRGDTVTLKVPAFAPGGKVWLKISAKGHGWFGSHGEILVTKK